MPTGNDKFNAAANEAGCNFLLAAGGAATSFATYSLLTGSLVTGAAGAAVAGIAAYAYANNCQWDPDDPGPPTPQPVSGCKKFSSGTGQWHTQSGPIWETTDPPVVEVTRFEYRSYPPELPNTEHVYNIEWLGPNGTSAQKFYTPGTFVEFSVVPNAGAVCAESFDPTPPTIPPYTYTDPDDGCQIQVTFQGWGVDGGGSYGPVWQMDPILPPARTGGGIIGGCNFTPIIQYQPPGGPPVPPVPIPPSPSPGPDGQPWWVAALMGAIGGVAAAAADKVLEKLFEEVLPAGNRTIRAACEYKENGDPETYTVNFPAESWADRVITAIDAGVDFQQQILLWKTPTCSGGGSSVTGDAVSINWVSDEYSPNGNDRIRKLLIYFDQVGSTLEQTVAHWKDITWNAGPVIVSVNGVPLGKPQVWAESADEGKRVINHAAAIAGVDMSKAEWLITSPRSSRYGMAGLMRVHRSENGTLGITKRDGPSGSPMGLT